MTYESAARTLAKHRYKHKKRLDRSTLLIRTEPGVICIRLWNTDIITFHEDGRIEVKHGWWGYTVRERLNHYLPVGWDVVSQYGQGFILMRNGKPKGIIPSGGQSRHRFITLYPSGHVKGTTAKAVERARRLWLDRRNENARRRQAQRYWMRKARTGEKFSKKLTTQVIESEQNITVKMAMIKCFGLDRFIEEIGAKKLHVFRDYELIEYRGNMATQTSGWRQQAMIRALRMVCPSTKMVYIHAVPPHVSSVQEALNWMFQTQDYVARIGQQT